MRIRVLVVDDSLFMRTLIGRMLQEDPEIEVVGTASNGLQAVEEVHRLQPDVVTMDIEMPVMNGIDAVRKIMAERPTPVVILTALSKESVEATITALGCGAVDFLEKPVNVAQHYLETQAALVEKVKIAARLVVQPAHRRVPARESLQMDDKGLEVDLPAVMAKERHVVAIGTSTGGPRALDEVFRGLPRNFTAPILVVQHMPSPFTRSLAERLNTIAPVRVKEAVDGEPVVPQTAYIAPGGWHMEVCEHGGQLQIRLHQGARRHGHRPSVDVLFESLASLSSIHRVLVLMTGMGTDGAEGMRQAKLSGTVTTIAEAEETCTVFGMPRAAIELGCVDFVVPLQEIPRKIVDVIHVQSRARRIGLGP